MTNPIRILLVDDHETVRAGLRALLHATPELCLVDDVPDDGDVVDAVRDRQVNLVVLDLSMPVSGMVVLRRLKSRAPNVAAVVFTRHRSADYVHEALSAGADAYVLKQSPFSTLQAAIAVAAGGGQYLDPALEQVDPAPRHEVLKLSGRETEVLRLGASGHANKDIAASLGIAVKTVEVHKSNAMRKLNLHDRSEVLKFAIRQGWLPSD
jgi:DNA-binding NarL/FixJ family response regulator